MLNRKRWRCNASLPNRNWIFKIDQAPLVKTQCDRIPVQLYFYDSVALLIYNHVKFTGTTVSYFFLNFVFGIQKVFSDKTCKKLLKLFYFFSFKQPTIHCIYFQRVENCFEKRDPAWRYKYMQDATYQKEIHFHASYRLMLELCIEITCAPISAIHEAVQELERAVVCPFLKLEET